MLVLPRSSIENNMSWGMTENHPILLLVILSIAIYIERGSYSLLNIACKIDRAMRVPVNS
jgi:hypothetical protein